jgi:hypothetical protein
VHFILKVYSYFNFRSRGVGSCDCWISVSVVYCTRQLVELFTAKRVCSWSDCRNMEMMVLRQKFLFAARCSTLVSVTVDPLMNGKTEGGSDNADCRVLSNYIYTNTHTHTHILNNINVYT